MMKIEEYIDVYLLSKMVELGFVNKIHHPKFPLTMFSYSRKCFEEKYWNEVTTKCRGLIINEDTHEVIARPFNKFFNIEEYMSCEYLNSEILKEKTKGEYIISEKLDGSLGILYWYNNVPYLTTNGSFKSDMGVHGTNILKKKYTSLFSQLNRKYTYLFEIIYPENKMCVSYKDIDDIFLIGVINIEDGTEIEPSEETKRLGENSFNTPKIYKNINWEEIRNIIPDDNKEGYVVKFIDNNFRIKVKYEKYKMLHYLKSNFQDKSIFEAVSTNKFSELYKNCKTFLDEESLIIVKEKAKSYYNEYYKIYDTFIKENKPLKNFTINDDGKIQIDIDYVNYCKSTTYPQLAFGYVRGNDINKIIWDIVKRKWKIKN